MISTRAIEIVPLMEEPFDYDEYVVKCNVMDFQILPLGQYINKLGIYKSGLVKHPHLSPKQAYLMMIGDIRNTSKRPQSTTTTGTGCCGGAKIK
jgi:hypothetical protein